MNLLEFTIPNPTVGNGPYDWESLDFEITTIEAAESPEFYLSPIGAQNIFIDFELDKPETAGLIIHIIPFNNKGRSNYQMIISRANHFSTTTDYGVIENSSIFYTTVKPKKEKNLWDMTIGYFRGVFSSNTRASNFYRYTKNIPNRLVNVKRANNVGVVAMDIVNADNLNINTQAGESVISSFRHGGYCYYVGKKQFLEGTGILCLNLNQNLEGDLGLMFRIGTDSITVNGPSGSPVDFKRIINIVNIVDTSNGGFIEDATKYGNNIPRIGGTNPPNGIPKIPRD